MFGTKEKPKTEIALGSKVRDKITGLEGIVIGHSRWLHNCDTYMVQPEEVKDGKVVDSSHFESPRLKVIQENLHAETAIKTGGPIRHVPSPIRHP